MGYPFEPVKLPGNTPLKDGDRVYFSDDIMPSTFVYITQGRGPNTVRLHIVPSGTAGAKPIYVRDEITRFTELVYFDNPEALPSRYR